MTGIYANTPVIDIETNGTDPATCEILELSCRVYNHSFTKDVAEVKYLVKYELQALYDMYQRTDPYVQNMHKNNNLWQDLQTVAVGGQVPGYYVLPSHELGENFLQFLRTYAPHVPTDNPDKPIKPMCAGNNVEGFDLRFIELEWPEVKKHFHHRTINMSSLREVTHRVKGRDFYEENPQYVSSHRSMSDVDTCVHCYFWCLLALAGK